MSEPADIPLRRSVRARLLLIALLPLLVLLPLLLLTSVKSWSNRLEEVLIAKVQGELTIARQHLSGLQGSRAAAVEALARSVALDEVLRRDGIGLASFLEAERARMGFDFLYFVAPDGQVVMATSLGEVTDVLAWPVVQQGLEGNTFSAIDVLDETQLARLAPFLAARARIALVPTKAAVPTDRNAEARGMVIHAAAGAPGGAIVGGLLLNRNLGFIDDINALVYPADSLSGGEGTATLFLDDVRISTNVRLFEDVRALGTRVSAEVRNRVLIEGRTWLDRAFVVNDWYVSGYQPLTDSFGRIVGMLYVGFLERDFAAAEARTILWIGLLFVVVVAIFVPVLLIWAQGIFRPLESMNAVIGQVEGGQFGARVSLAGGGTGDEIGRVAQHLDKLLDQLQERDRSLREWAEVLEQRVAERTKDLEDANRQLDLTTKQLILSEKLAAIGEITAGVAHEINNPLAVIQGNLDVIRAELGEVGAAPFRREFALIQDRIQAVHVLIGKLLRFARPEEFADTGHGVDPGQTIRDTIPLLDHLMARGGIVLDLDLAETAPVAINKTELQQVLVNLCVNAIQAMPDGGHLSISLREVVVEGRDLVQITVTDSGPGMPEAVARRVFDPFFTTKGGEGTGLGLSITRDILRRAGGGIELAAAPSQGARFVIRLPVTDRALPD